MIIAKLYGNEMLEYVCGTAVFFGHIWPILYRFRGGKGIATGFGIILAIDYRCGLICLVCAVLVAFITNRMSCGSIVAAMALPVMFFFLHRSYIVWAIGICLIVIFMHRANIKRLIEGTEPEIGFLKKLKEKSK